MDESAILYNFNTLCNRTSHHEAKYHSMQNLVAHLDISVPKDVIPLWIADMDFIGSEHLISTLVSRARHGIFGYTETPESLFALVAQWLQEIHALTVEPNSVRFSGGTMHSVMATLLACTEKGDDVITFQPIYGPLLSIATQHDRNLIVHNLDQSGDMFTIDFEKLKSQITPRTTLLILCNPHNPGGRTWTKQELLQIAELCIAHNITICSNDTHNDVVYSDTNYIPLISLGKEIADITVTCMSIGKTFNASGLHAAHIVCPNPTLLLKVNTQLERIWGTHILNIFAIEAYASFYTHGYTWYRQVIAYLEENRNFVFHYITHKLPPIRPFMPQATYLMWLDCNAISSEEHILQKIFIEKARVFLSQGSFFGESGIGFMRLNFASPKHILEEALHRIYTALQ